MKTQIRKWLEDQSKKPALESADVEGKVTEVPVSDKPVEVELEAPKDVQEEVPQVQEEIKAVSVEEAEEVKKEECETPEEEAKEKEAEEVKEVATEEASEEVPVEEVKAEQAVDAPVVEAPSEAVAPVEEVPAESAEPIATVVEEEPVISQEDDATKLVTDAVVSEEPKAEEAPIEKPADEKAPEAVAVPADEHGEVPPVVVPAPSEEVKEEVEETKEEVSTEEAKSEEALILEDVTTSVGEKQKEAEDVASDIDEMEEAQIAMERYMEILTEAQGEGGLSQQAASIMRVNLESYEKRFGLEKPMTPALEAFGGSMSQRAATNVSLEGIKEVVEMIKKAIAAAWQHLKEAVAALIARFKTSVDSHTKKIDELKKAVSSLDGKAKGQAVSLSNPGLLFADGDWLGNEKGAISLTGIAAFALNEYPNLLIKFQQELHSKAMKGVESGDVKAIQDLGEAIFKKAIDAFPAVDVVEQEQGYETRQHLPLFGNKNLVLKTPGAGYTSNRTPMLLSIIDLNRGKPAPEKFDTEPTTKASLESRIKRFEEIVKVMDGFGDIAAKLKTASEAVINDVKTAQEKVAGEAKGEVAKEEQAAINKKLHMLSGVLNTANVLNAQYSGVIAYVDKVLGVQLALAEREVKSFKA